MWEKAREERSLWESVSSEPSFSMEMKSHRKIKNTSKKAKVKTTVDFSTNYTQKINKLTTSSHASFANSFVKNRSFYLGSNAKIIL